MAFGIIIWLSIGVLVGLLFGASARAMGGDRKVSC